MQEIIDPITISYTSILPKKIELFDNTYLFEKKPSPAEASSINTCGFQKRLWRIRQFDSNGIPCIKTSKIGSIFQHFGYINR